MWNLWQRSDQAEVISDDLLVESIDFADGRNMLAVGCYDGTVILRNHATSKEIRRWDAHDKRVITVEFNHDETRLVTTDASNSVIVWEVDTGRPLHRFEGQWSADFADKGDVLAFRNRRSAVIVSGIATQDEPSIRVIENTDPRQNFAVCLSPDGKRVATAGRSGGVSIWDTSSLDLIQRLPQRNWVWTLAWSPTGQHLATGEAAGGLRIWEAETFRGATAIEPHSNTVYTIEFAPDGKTLASGSTDNTCKLWDVPSCTLRQTLIGHSGEVASLAFSDDGESLLSASIDGHVRRWNLADWQGNDLFKHPAAVDGAAFSPNGHELVTTCVDGKLRIWDVKRGSLSREVDAHDGSVYRCRFLTHRGRQSIVSSGADSRIRLWDAASLERQGEFQSRPDKDDPIAITISRSGDHAAFCNSPQTVAIWDLRRNQLVSELAVSYVGNIAFSPSEDLLAILYRNRVSVWDPKEQRRLVDTQIDARVARQVVFSPDGSTLAVACHDGNVKLIDIAAFFARRRKTSYRTPIRIRVGRPDGRIRTRRRNHRFRRRRLIDPRLGCVQRRRKMCLIGTSRRRQFSVFRPRR